MNSLAGKRGSTPVTPPIRTEITASDMPSLSPGSVELILENQSTASPSTGSNADIIEKEELMANTSQLTGAIPLSEAQQELLQLELEERREALAKRKQAKEEFERGREANIRDVKTRHENQKRVQAACSHRNEHNRTNVRGQRDHDQNTIWLCQSCQKMWKDFAREEDAKRPENLKYERLPTGLYPNTEVIWVGGPVAS